jgi:hypothetical protein
MTTYRLIPTCIRGPCTILLVVERVVARTRSCVVVLRIPPVVGAFEFRGIAVSKTLAGSLKMTRARTSQPTAQTMVRPADSIRSANTRQIAPNAIQLDRVPVFTDDYSSPIR